MSIGGHAGWIALGFVAGFGSGAWIVLQNVQKELDDTRGPLGAGIIDELERRGRAARASAAPTAPPDAATRSSAAASPLDRPPDAEPPPHRSTESKLMPEPPASWMTAEQQRKAAEAYREWVRDASRLAMERTMGLNAELFMIESQDPAWGALMESKVRASMAGSPVFDGAALEAIECRVTVCRATVRFADADNPRGLLQNGGRSPWSEWRNAQIRPVRTEINDGVPGFRATVYLGEDFDQPRLPRGVRAPGPGGP